MSDKPSTLFSHVEALATAPPGTRLSQWQILVRVIAISIPVLGALPTATNLYYSWTHQIPFSQVSHRLAQYDLWVKNVSCQIDYHALTTGQGTRVDVGTCPKTGDIAIKVSGKGEAVAYEWIAFDQLEKPTAQAGMTFNLFASELFVSPAHAEAAPGSSPAATVAVPQSSTPQSIMTPPVRLAQAGMQVICQAMGGKQQIIRIINEAGKCFRETISPLQGKVEKKEEVPCNTQCVH